MNEAQRFYFKLATLVFTAFLVWVFRSPDYLGCLFLLLLARKPKSARKAVHERFEDIEHKLEQLAQLITGKGNNNG